MVSHNFHSPATFSKMQIKLHDIEWDTDGKDVDLPSEVWVNNSFPNGHILTEEDLLELTDKVSDEYGWYINTLNYTAFDSD